MLLKEGGASLDEVENQQSEVTAPLRLSKAVLMTNSSRSPMWRLGDYMTSQPKTIARGELLEGHPPLPGRP